MFKMLVTTSLRRKVLKERETQLPNKPSPCPNKYRINTQSVRQRIGELVIERIRPSKRRSVSQ